MAYSITVKAIGASGKSLSRMELKTHRDSQILYLKISELETKVDNQLNMIPIQEISKILVCGRVWSSSEPEKGKQASELTIPNTSGDPEDLKKKTRRTIESMCWWVNELQP